MANALLSQRPAFTQVTQAPAPFQVVGADGRPIFEILEGVAGPILRLLGPTGAPLVELGANWTGDAHVVCYHGDHAGAEMIANNEGGIITVAAGGDSDGPFAALIASNEGGGHMDCGAGGSEFRTYA